MPRVYVSAVVDAPSADVWAVIRDFDRLADWHPVFIESSKQSEGAANEPGATRRLVLEDRSVIIEELLGLNDMKRTTVYRIIAAPLPITGYVATLRVSDITEGGMSFLEWWSSFDCPPEDAADLKGAVSDIYRSGIRALNERFAR